MNRLNSFINQQIQYYKKWDLLIFTILVLLSILNETTTVFYVIYFFWWNELIRIVVDRFYYKRNPNVIFEEGGQHSIFHSLMQMGIYFVFIVVFFGIIANWGNSQMTMANMGVLFFQNWFFNVNLIFIFLERIYLHRTQQQLHISFGIFTTNMIVLHISIILGGISMFFIVKNFPTIFTPDNLWGSVLIVLPFLLLKMAIQHLSSSK